MIKEHWKYGLATHNGTRKRNEDSSFLRLGRFSSNETFLMAMVADGIGGYSEGKFASNFAIEQIKDWWNKRIDGLLLQEQPLIHISNELKMIFKKVNDDLNIIGNKENKKIGTTLSLLFLYNSNFFVLHIGDSRIYKLFSSETVKSIKQLTDDHTWINYMVESNKLTKEEARSHQYKNVLLQSLGVNSRIQVYKLSGNFRKNDIFLLCSDGFYSVFSDEDIVNIIDILDKKGKSLQYISEKLVEKAIKAGATDNISVILIKKVTFGSCIWKKIINIS